MSASVRKEVESDESELINVGGVIRRGRRWNCQESGGVSYNDISSQLFTGCVMMMRWVLKLVETGTEGEARCMDVMEIVRPDDLGDIADLGLTLAEAKVLLGCVQQEVAAAQARGQVVRRPNCRSGGGACHLKDYRDHRIATLFGRVTVRLPRFRCAVAPWRPVPFGH